MRWFAKNVQALLVVAFACLCLQIVVEVPLCFRCEECAAQNFQLLHLDVGTYDCKTCGHWQPQLDSPREYQAVSRLIRGQCRSLLVPFEWLLVLMIALWLLLGWLAGQRISMFALVVFLPAIMALPIALRELYQVCFTYLGSGNYD